MERHSLKDRLISLLAGADIEMLRQSEEENRAILNNVIDGIITIDESGAILRFNPAAEKIFGFTQEEAVGKNVILMPNRNSVQQIHKTYHHRKGKIIGIGQRQGRRKDGSLFLSTWQ
jgi:PAS domain S-box-containing protein